jgi:hypothetical protein
LNRAGAEEGDVSLTYQVRNAGGHHAVDLAGALTETAGPVLLELAGELGACATIAFDCRSINNITSVGVRLWVKFLSRLPATAAVEFHHCSTYFIDYANLVPLLTEKGQVVSFEMPYRCATCGSSSTVLVRSEGVQPDSDFAPQACKCGGEARPDVNTQDYLTFLFM